MNKILERISEYFSVERVADFFAGSLIPNLIVGLLVFLFFYLLYRVLAKVAGVAMRKSPLDRTAKDFVITILKSVVLAIGLVSSLSQMGIDTGALLTSLGVAGLTLGFAARDTLSNVISGFFIFLDRPFVVDDLVEIDGKYGRVERITMRSTRVVTVDGKMLAIPNATIANSTVASYTNFPHLRIDVPFTIGTGEDFDKVRGLLFALVESDKRFASEPAPALVVAELNDYNCQVELRAWLQNERDHIKVRFELRERIYETLRAAGVDMPLETFRIEPVTVHGVGKAA